MKRLVFVLITGILLVGLSDSGWSKAGFWAGPRGFYFLPSKENVQVAFKTFWGWGGEVGWAYKHIESSLALEYARARGEEDIWWAHVPGFDGTYREHLSVLTLTPRVAFRLEPQRTPYAGFGVGYQKVTWGLQKVSDSHPIGLLTGIVTEKPIGQPPSPGQPTLESYATVSVEAFMGYDYRLVKWSGIRGEWSYRMSGEVKQNKAWLYAHYQTMGGWKASLGAYVAW